MSRLTELTCGVIETLIKQIKSLGNGEPKPVIQTTENEYYISYQQELASYKLAYDVLMGLLLLQKVGEEARGSERKTPNLLLKCKQGK